MNSSLYGKIEKAIRYQQEPDRIRFEKAQVVFRGNHDNYTVTLDNTNWHCNCHTFATGFETCSHIMALQRILHDMLDVESRSQHIELMEHVASPAFSS
ncbi:MAG TPA: hypothetical protein VH186_37085 [Chloroflexia bacterium]|nr:hypothetical protein [Chloroflexia bacterium]